MFDKNFYPTPKPIAEKICAGINILEHRVLEPSAGKGDIVDCLQLSNSYHRAFKYPGDSEKYNVYCIERVPELQAILRGKRWNVIYSDFLTYRPDLIFDYILMNPPFEDGAKHLLKAIEIARGAEIRCLLNAETIKNPYTKERQALVNILNDSGADIEELGACFQKSERPTNVEVVMITLKTKTDSKDFFKFVPSGKDELRLDLETLTIENQIVRFDMAKNMESRFNLVLQGFVNLIKAKAEIEFYAQGLYNNEYNDISDLIQKEFCKNNTAFYNRLVERFRSICWTHVLRQTKIAQFLTHKLQQNFQEMQREQGYLPFTAENIDNLIMNLFFNSEEIAQNCIEDAFDLLTKYHKENRCYKEGWKTNDRWQVNKKVILPLYFNEWDRQDPIRHYPFSGNGDALIDIEKSLCIIAGKKHEESKSIQTIMDSGRCCFGIKYYSDFFEFRVYKKGTIHLTFRDDYIYEQFNIIACKAKKWLKGA